MSDAFWVALFGLLASCITTVLSYANRQELRANGVAQLVTAGEARTAATNAGLAVTKAETAADLVKANNAKTDQLIEGTEKIHQLVNSGSDKMKAEIAALKAEVVIANARTDKLAGMVSDLLTRQQQQQQQP